MTRAAIETGLELPKIPKLAKIRDSQKTSTIRKGRGNEPPECSNNRNRVCA
jgi:hypothetical protein